MRNYVQAGGTLTVPAPYNLDSGDMAVIGSIYGVAAIDAATGDDVQISTGGVFTLPKVSALAIAIGEKVYFDSAAKLVTKTASGNTLIGVAVTAAANPSASVNVRLNPAF
jgi:predicted RecA/RadA family phage recombinase